MFAFPLVKFFIQNFVQDSTNYEAVVVGGKRMASISNSFLYMKVCLCLMDIGHVCTYIFCGKRRMHWMKLAVMTSEAAASR